jgi:hypothetical protein
MLTKEESLVMMARNLEVTHRVDGVVYDVDGNVKATKMLVEDIDDNVKATTMHIRDVEILIRETKVLVEEINDNVKETTKRLSLFDAPIVKDDTCSQGLKINFDHGSLLQIPPSIIILHAKLTTVELPRGLSKAEYSRIGRKVAPCCGSVEIVRFSSAFYFCVY